MLYLLSKLLPLAVLPLGVALLLLLAAWLGRRRWPLPAALSVLTLFSTGWMAQLLWRSVEAPLAAPIGGFGTACGCNRGAQRWSPCRPWG